MDNAAVDDELPSENVFETLQDAENTIVKITEIIQVLRTAKQTLNLVSITIDNYYRFRVAPMFR